MVLIEFPVCIGYARQVKRKLKSSRQFMEEVVFMSININILPQGTLAIYEQIIMQLKNAIVTGELKSGEALPSIRALAADLQVSVITTKRAYEELEKEGLIRSVAGKGFYVCEYNTDYLKEKQFMMIEKRTQEIIYEAKNAGLSCDDLVDMIRTLYEEK